MGVVEVSRSGSDNLGLCVLAAVTALFVASGTALADVDVSVDKGICTQAFEILPLERQPHTHTHTPGRDITYQIDVDRNSLPRVKFTDILSTTTGLGQSADINYYSSTGTQTPTAKVVRKLPAGPGGATLFLMGVGCIGAVKLGKSARGLRLQSLPEWYHTGGPIQVGHAAAFDFDYSAPVFSTLDETAGEQQLRHHPRRDLPLRCDDQFLLTVEAPRGPPRLCS